MILALRARVASGSRFWTILGSVFTGFWPSRWLKPLLKFLLDRPRAVQELFFSALEPSKRAARGLQERFQRHPGEQDAPRGLRGAVWQATWLHSGPIWDQFVINFKFMLDPEGPETTVSPRGLQELSRRPQILEHCQEPAKSNHPFH